MLLGKSFSNAYVYEINVYILKLQNVICQLGLFLGYWFCSIGLCVCFSMPLNAVFNTAVFVL